MTPAHKHTFDKVVKPNLGAAIKRYEEKAKAVGEDPGNRAKQTEFIRAFSALSAAHWEVEQFLS